MLLGTSCDAFADVHYVDINSTNATPPFTTWATAATNIQDAVDAAAAGDEVVVTNGTYARVFVGNPLIVRSVNGPQVTLIHGGGRCAYLTNGASLSGFTLTGGRISIFNGSIPVCGAGAYGGTLNNCILTRNSISATSSGNHPSSHPFVAGGGAANCTLNDCILSDNSASATNRDTYGSSSAAAVAGGAFACTLNNCVVSGNLVSAVGGYYAANYAVARGGGTGNSVLNNCTLVGNSVIGYPGYSTSVAGGGSDSCSLNNSIAYFNTVDEDFSTPDANCYGGTLDHSCTTPDPGGIGNITNAPLFVDTNGWADLHLQFNSPCINAGNNSYITNATDLDGNPRVVGGTVDVGAYEYQTPVSQISYAWLQQFALPISNSTDSADPDGDGVDNYHEWLAGTAPINPLSSPAQLTITPSGVPANGIVVTWSTNAVGFILLSTPSPLLAAAWVTNSPAPVVIAGQNTVTNSLSDGQRFYRLIR